MYIRENGNHSIQKGEVIYLEGNAVNSISMILRGRVEVLISSLNDNEMHTEKNIIENSYKMFSLEPGYFMGVNDIFQSKKHSATYIAEEDCNIYTFVMDDMDSFKLLYEQKREYLSFIVRTISTNILQARNMLDDIEGMVKSLQIFTDNISILFWQLVQKYNLKLNPTSNHFKLSKDWYDLVKDKHLPVVSRFDPQFLEQDISDKYRQSEDINTDYDMIEYYERLSAMNIQIFKEFFSEDYVISYYHIQNSSNIISSLYGQIKSNLLKLNDLVKSMCLGNEENIYNVYILALSEINNSGVSNQEFINVVDCIINKINEIDAFFTELYDKQIINNMDDLYKKYQFANAVDSTMSNNLTKILIDSDVSMDTILDEVRDSALRIIQYSGIDSEKGKKFLENLIAFRALRDKFSSDSHSRSIRSAINSLFFEIYDAVYNKYMKQGSEDKVIHMFLNFCYMDEQLLDHEQIAYLYNLSCEQPDQEEIQVHSIKDWLNNIYNKQKEPSINEFDQDYYDNFRELKKRKHYSEQEERAYLNNNEGKVTYEISNMFRITHKLCYGQISSYVPFLHKDMFIKSINNSLVTKEMVRDSMQRIMEIDYSAFYRELLLHKPEKGIEKELIMKAVMPDIILLPTFGANGIMWQDISGRRRDTPGRFILPMFTADNIDDMLIKVIGRFKWELCRTMMGASWNDILVKSLTSEYSDYIQFYKKNRDLSTDAKEKVKLQIQKSRNIMREIFTLDYETWIKYESKGAIRLNKVARSLMFTYCPFSKNIREQLLQQPIYAEAASKYNQESSKKIRELENRYNYIERNYKTVDPELIETLKYYRDL